MIEHINPGQLNSYLHQTLTDAEREALDRHLANCPTCRTRLNNFETLQRRIRNQLTADLRRIRPSTRMSYAAIAPHLKRSRRFTMVLKQSNQFIYGALTMALLVAVGVGLYVFVSNLSRPIPTTLESVQTTAVPTVLGQPEINPTAQGQPAVVVPSQGDNQPAEFVMQITGDPNPLSLPVGLAVDAQGHLYVLDAGHNRLQIFDSTGQFLTLWGSFGTGEGEFNLGSHGGVAVDRQGHVYVADSGNTRIQKFDQNGQFLTKWGSWGRGDGQFSRPIGVAVDGQGHVYVIDDYRNDIQKFDSQGQFLTKWGGAGSGDGQFSNTGRIAVDEQGYIYVADFGNNRVQKFDSNGQFLAKWGGAGSGDGQFRSPIDIAVDKQGYVYVVEEGGNRVQKFDSNGQFLTKWGSAGSGEGEFSAPYDVEVDEQGNIYVSDYYNNRVQKFRQGSGGSAQGNEPPNTSQLLGTLVPDVAPDAELKLSAGLYRTRDEFAIPFTFEIGEGWQGYAFPTDFGLLRGKNSISHANAWLSFFPLPTGFQPNNVIAELRATEKLESGAMTEVSYHGFEALQFEAQAQPNPENKGGEVEPGTIAFQIIGDILGPGNSGPGNQWWAESPQARFRFTLLEVNGRSLLIYFEAPQEVYESLIPEVDQILNSIEFAGQ